MPSPSFVSREAIQQLWFDASRPTGNGWVIQSGSVWRSTQAAWQNGDDEIVKTPISRTSISNGVWASVLLLTCNAGHHNFCGPFPMWQQLCLVVVRTITVDKPISPYPGKELATNCSALHFPELFTWIYMVEETATHVPGHESHETRQWFEWVRGQIWWNI